MSEENKQTKFDKILEGYRPMPMGRMFYPRGMKLSEDFVNSFHREYDRLVSEGQNPKSLLERFGKALKFHVSETRKYHQLDEKGKVDPSGKADMSAHDAANKRVKDQKAGKGTKKPATAKPHPALKDIQNRPSGAK